MKAIIVGPNGPVEIEVGAAVNQMAALGAVPGMPPGKTALQILLGWPHGSTAGLGGVDWRANCGVHRGEHYPIGPSYDDFTKGKEVCEKLMGVGGLCLPQFPKGSWLIPFQTRIPVSAAADAPNFSQIEIQMTQAQRSRLYALEICAKRGTPIVTEPPTEDPCPCEGGCCSGCGSFDDVYVGGWQSRVINGGTYPQSGRDSKVITTTSAGVVTEANMEFGDQDWAPWCRYSSQALLNGQNFLPPWVQNAELMRTNDDVSFIIQNRSLLFAAEIDIVFHLAYGQFNATEYATACGCVAA